MLSRETELDLIRLAQGGDSAALASLINAFEPMICRAARRRRTTSPADFDDLKQEARIGFMRAIKSFDPSLGHRLATYATFWIRSAMNEADLDVIKVSRTAPVKRFFYALARGLSDADAALVAGIDAATAEAIAARGRISSLDGPAHDGEDADTFLDQLAGGDLAEEVERSAESATYTRAFALALDALDQRSRLVVEMMLDGATLEEVGDEIGVSRERIRQISAVAFKRIAQAASPVLGLDVPARIVVDRNVSRGR